MMTVLQVIPSLEAGGAERTTIDIAGAIQSAGGRALVASQGGRLEAELIQCGAELIRLPVAAKDPVTILLNAGRLESIIRERKVALIHARSRAPAWSALLAARAARIPFLTTYHGAYKASGPLKKFYNSVMAAGDLVIANSQYTADEIAKVYKIQPSRLVVIPRGTDFKAFERERIAPGRIAALKSEWALGAHQGPLLLLPGRLTRWKGQLVLIEALTLLKAAGQLGGAAAVLAGDAKDHEDYRAEIARGVADAGLETRVRIVGHVADMPAAYAAATLVVSPATEPEAFGRVAVEASAIGVAVIASDQGGARETVVTEPENARTGWRVKPGDARALADAIGAALELPAAELTAIGIAGAAFVRRHYSLQAMCRATLETYLRALDERR
jgi:glycosyltransferase involved in cell wall biosynthesis